MIHIEIHNSIAPMLRLRHLYISRPQKILPSPLQTPPASLSIHCPILAETALHPQNGRCYLSRWHCHMEAHLLHTLPRRKHQHIMATWLWQKQWLDLSSHIQFDSYHQRQCTNSYHRKHIVHGRNYSYRHRFPGPFTTAARLIRHLVQSVSLNCLDIPSSMLTGCLVSIQCSRRLGISFSPFSSSR